jgi:DNA-binding MarR family transcriptional regulator
MSASVKLDRLRETLEAVLEADQEFPVRRLQILLYVASKGPVTSSEISDILKLYPANTGAHLKSLATEHNGKEGLGLIEIGFQGNDYRSKYAKITLKGEKFLKKLTDTL